MELTNDPLEAEVVVLYLLELKRALLLDKRRFGNIPPLVEAFPQQELLLEGKPAEAPLVPEVIHAIEHHRVLPSEPHIMALYLRKLVEVISWKLAELRPALSSPHLLTIGPHFAPIMILAHSPMWTGLLRQLEEREEVETARQARALMKELFALELS